MKMVCLAKGTHRPTGGSRRRSGRSVLLLACFLALQSPPVGAGEPAAGALPTGGQIVAGQGGIAQSGNAMTIRQDSARMVTNWQNFDIGSQATVTFQQPSVNAAVLNRVQSADPSRIQGQLQANGQVFILNPSGVIFGPSSRVDAGAIVASTLQMNDTDFMNGNYHLQGGGGGSVINQGRLAASNGGFVALIGGSVSNSGEIVATEGQVGLAAGDAVRLDLTGNGLVGIQVETGAAGAHIDNTGLIAADGGTVYLTVQQAAPVLGTAINQSGIVRANTLGARNGEVWLNGGNGKAELSGLVEARGLGAEQQGGRVVVMADHLAVSGRVDASGGAGGGRVELGGGWQGKDPAIGEARRTEITSTARVSADATHAGDGGTLVAWSRESTRMDGTFSARGAGVNGQGGKAETSSRGSLGVDGLVLLGAASGRAGEWLLDPNDITVSTGADSNVNASFTATGSPAVVNKTSIETALNNDTNVTLTTDGTITIDSDISKTACSVADCVNQPVTFTLDAIGDITLSSGKAISSIAGELNVNFGTSSHNAGTATLAGPVSTNGGYVNFYKATSLAHATPVSTKVLSAVFDTSGNITFHQDVTLAAVGLAVSVSAQGAQSGASYVGNGGTILFNGKIESGIPTGIATAWPQALSVDTTGVSSGAITFGDGVGQDDVGTVALNTTFPAGNRPLASLTLAGPTTITLNADEINLAATSGNVLTASSNNGVPTLKLVAADTAIRVTGGTINGVTGYADYRQETFDISVNDATARTLSIYSDRSIKIKNRTIDGVTNAGASTLKITLDTLTADPALAIGGAVVLDTATLKSNGGDIIVGGKDTDANGVPNDYAVGYGSDLEGITDGIRVYNSTLTSAGGNIYLSGKSPTTSSSGSGVLLYGLTSLSAGGGNLVLDGRVTAASTAGNKDAIVIGEGSNSRTTLETSGNGTITLVGDASGVVNATSGSRYDGIILSSNALLKTVEGDIVLTGKGGSGLSDSYVSDQNHGIKLETDGTSVVSTTGDITLAGKSGGKSDSYGIYSRGNTMYLGKESGGAASGVITLAADSMQFINTSTSRLLAESTGELRIRPWTSSTAITFGTAGSTDKLYLGSSWFSGTNAIFQPGFEDMTVGWSDVANVVDTVGFGVNTEGTATTGTLTVASATTIRDNLNFRMTGVGGKAVFDAPLTVQGASSANRVLSLNLNAGATGSGAIAVDKLQLLGSGDMVLSGNNLVSTLAINTGNKVTLNNAQTLTVGQVTSRSLFTLPTADVTTTGITTTNDDVTLATSIGNLVVTQNVGIGTGAFSLRATAGKVEESGAATPIITANKLAVSARDTSSLANNNVVGILAGAITGAGNDLTFVGTAGINVESVTDGGGTTLSGLSVAGNAFLTAQNGAVTQSGANAANVGAGGLFLDVTGGSATLSRSTNTIGTLAARMRTAGAALSVSDWDGLTAGTVGGNSGITTTSGGNVTLNASADAASTSGDLSVIQPIQIGSGTLLLTSGKGALSESGSGLLTAASLYAAAASSSSLAITTNDVDTLSADISGSGASFTFKDVDDVTIGSVNSRNGITTQGGQVIVMASAASSSTAGNLVLSGGATLNTTASSGSRGDITLRSDKGTVTESAGSVVTGNGLQFYTSDSVDFTAGSHDLKNLSAYITKSGASLSFTQAGSITIGTVDGISGISTNSGNVSVTTTGTSSADIVLDKSITAGTGVVNLNAANGGGVNEQSSATITADWLLVQAKNSSMLLNDNQIGTLAVKGGGGTFGYRDWNDLNIGTVSGISGVDTGGGELFLGMSNLTLNANLIVGTSLASLNAAGSITENSGVRVAAQGLRMLSTGSISMLESGNAVETLAAYSSGSLAYRGGDSLTIGSLTGSFGSGSLSTAGVSTSSSEIYLDALRGNLTLGRDVWSGNGLTTLSAGGNVSQFVGKILSSSLRVVAGGAVSLTDTANNVNDLAGYSGTGSFSYRDTNDLVIRSLTGNLGGGTLTTNGVESRGESVWVRAGGNLTLMESVRSGSTRPQSVVLAAGQRFYNQVGTIGISSGGHWLIYDDNPQFLDNRGGLKPDFVIFERTYAAMPPERVIPAGNGYITTAIPMDPEQYIRQAGGAAGQEQRASSVVSALGMAQTAPIGTPSVVVPGLVQGGLQTGSFLASLLTTAAPSAQIPVRVAIESGGFFESQLSDILGGAVGPEVTQADGQPLPTWMSWDPARRTIMGEPPANFDGPVVVRVMVQEGDAGAYRPVDIRFDTAAVKPAVSPTGDKTEEEAEAVL
ncbi:MAG: filamentous hemagglutinin N-terminal domain-containing protein [Magnetococcales bacterium]|nr:filamentous hemagglutinin N-terminal domain-containing protein [Magnetococcales bacterium]